MNKEIVRNERMNAIAFEFVKLFYEDDFERIAKIIIEDLDAEVIENVEAPYSDIYFFRKEGIEFSLEYDSVLGNSLVILGKDNQYCDYIHELAHKIFEIYQQKYQI